MSCGVALAALAIFWRSAADMPVSDPPIAPPRSVPTLPPRDPSPARAAPRVVQLPALYIVGSLSRRRRAPHRHRAPRVAELVPCSGWRDLGPVSSVREGEIPKERHVRLMCSRREASR